MKLRVLLVAAFIVAAVVQCYAQDNRQADAEPVLTTVTVIFEDGRGNSWTNRQVVPVTPKMFYSTNDVAYIGTVTEIRPDAVTEWQSMLQKVEVLWEEYSRRKIRMETMRKNRGKPRSRRNVVNELNAKLKSRYPAKEAK